MISTAQFAVDNNAVLQGLDQIKPTDGEGYSGYVLVAIPLKNGTWCPDAGVVTGYISLPSLTVQDAESIGRRI